MIDATVAGLVTGLSLIVAIGAQNAFVLRQGLAREHVGVVVLICTLSDVDTLVTTAGANPKTLDLCRHAGGEVIIA